MSACPSLSPTKAPAVAPTDLPRWLRIPAGARYLSVSLRTMYDLIKAGKVRVHRPSIGCPRVDRVQLDRFMQASVEGCGEEVAQGSET
jgi:excisionase family DNA binding protein